MKRPKATEDPDMLPEYDFRGAVRGKYFEQYQRGTNLVLIDPDLLDAFPDSASVNRALRQLLQSRQPSS